jgi:hypothetical protein
MPTYVQPRTLADLLLSEPIHLLTKQRVVLAGGLYELGTVLGKTEVDGVFRILAPGADDGTEMAVAVLAARVDASTEHRPALVISRLAAVAANRLIWPEGITPEQKAVALAQLEARHIVALDVL